MATMIASGPATDRPAAGGSSALSPGGPPGRMQAPGATASPEAPAVAGSRAGERALGVDVITVTYRSARHVGDCIACAVRSPLVRDVIVVDNASDDGSADAAERAGARTVVVNSENAGFARAVNQALRRATAPRVLLLNPDARVEPEGLALLHSLLAADPSVALAAPLLRDEAGAVRAGAGRPATVGRRVGLCVPLAGRAPALSPEYRLAREQERGGFVAHAGYVFGAVVLADRAFLEAAGGFDERFFLFAEDEDLCRRAHAAGRRVLLDGRWAARHAGGASTGDAAAVEAQRLYSTWKLFDKWGGGRQAAAYHHGVVGAFLLRELAAADGDARRAVRRTRRLLDAAVRSGAEPLLMDG